MPITTTGRATDFITFSRTSNATVTDSNGFIKWAGHNLLTNSESFDASAWNKANTTVSANNVVAPNGTATADRIVEQAVTDRHFVNQNDRISTASDTLLPHTLAVFAKAGERQYLNLSIEWSTNYVAATFDLSGGTVTSNRSGGTGTGNTSTITAVGSGWYLCTLTGILGTAGSNGAVIAIVTTATPTGAKGDTYLGDVTKGLYLWGAHLYRSDLGGMVLNPARGDAYYPTTPRNLLGYTEDFSNAAWGKVNVRAFGSGSVANAAVAPNGLQTADLVVPDTTNATHVFQQGPTVVNGTPYVSSIYAKAGGYSKIGIRDNSAFNRWVTFDLTGAGSIISTGSSASGSITAVGDGWYRIQMTEAAGASTMSLTLYLMDNGFTSGDPLSYSYAGNGTSGIYLWGAQLSDSASLDAYSPVYGAAVTSAAYYAPRLDYSGSSLAALGLLVEEQRTNVLLHSNDFSQAAWADAAPGSVVTVAANSTASPDGSTNAAKLTASTGGTNAMARQARTLVASTVYSGSIYIKGDTSTQSRMLLRDTTSGVNFADATINWSAGVPTIAGGATGTWSAVPVGGNWYRIVGTGTTGASPTPSVTFSLFPDTAAGTNAIFAYGAQLEAGSFATSYIPTGASTATRTADVASVSTQAFPYSATEGTVVVSATVINTAVNNNRFIGFNLASSQLANRMIDVFRASAQYANYKSSDAQQTNFGVWQDSSKVGVVYKADDYVFVANGGTVVTDTSTSGLSTADTMVIGQLNGGNQLNGHIRQITYIPRRLSNAELQARTL